jgi:hypothetical protein
VQVNRSHSKKKIHSAFRRAVAVLFATSLLQSISGCETAPPVQEMSDARQAISIAREAGAAEAAPDELKQAEELLVDAQRNLADRAYTQAKRNATQAKQKALEALAAVDRPE